jgi:hypothetical protein
MIMQGGVMIPERVLPHDKTAVSTSENTERNAKTREVFAIPNRGNSS